MDQRKGNMKRGKSSAPAYKRLPKRRGSTQPPSHRGDSMPSAPTHSENVYRPQMDDDFFRGFDSGFFDQSMNFNSGGFSQYANQQTGFPPYGSSSHPRNVEEEAEEEAEEEEEEPKKKRLYRRHKKLLKEGREHCKCTSRCDNSNLDLISYLC